MSNLIILGAMAVLGVHVQAANAQDANVQVVRTEGEPIQGELVSLDHRQVSVQVEPEKVVSLAWANVLDVRWTKANRQLVAGPQVWVRLRDQSLLLGEQFTTQAGNAALILLDENKKSLPTRVIRSVRFQDEADSPQLSRQWKEILQAKATGDLLVVRKTIASNKDPDAPVERTLDYLEGVVREVTEKVVRFEFDGDVIEAPRAKLEGVIYYRPATPEKPPFCFLEDAYGCRWALASLDRTDEARLRFTTVTGVAHAIPERRAMRCDFSFGKLLRLEELPSEVVEQQAFFDLGAAGALSKKFFRPRFGGTINGSALLLDGTKYARGLAIHSRTVAAFQIPPGFRRFQAMVGMDDRAGRRGNVSLEIIADGKSLARYVVKGEDPAFPVDLHIEHARRLVIVVDYGEGRDVQDQLDLGDARIAK